MATTDGSTPAYEELLERYGRATYLEDANAVLSWDQE